MSVPIYSLTNSTKYSFINSFTHFLSIFFLLSLDFNIVELLSLLYYKPDFPTFLTICCCFLFLEQLINQHVQIIPVYFKDFLKIIIYSFFKSKFKYHYNLAFRDVGMNNLSLFPQFERQEIKVRVIMWYLRHTKRIMLFTHFINIEQLQLIDVREQRRFTEKNGV